MLSTFPHLSFVLVLNYKTLFLWESFDGMKKIAIHWQILIALVLAVLLGAWFPEYSVYVSWMGKLFLSALKMIIVPLIFTSIVAGMANIGSGASLGRIGMKTIAYYLSTSTLAIITGLVLVNIIQPGVGIEIEKVAEIEGLSGHQTSIWETLMSIVPENVFQAMVEGDILSLIFFAMLVGFFIPRISGKRSEQLVGLMNGLYEVMMKITMFVILFTPLGVLGIVYNEVAQQSDLLELAKGLGGYALTVIIALLIHAFGVLPLALRLVGRVSPIKHLKAMSAPLLTAFSTSSSSATLPLTMEAVEDNGGVSNKISSFTLPLGATINMDGTALYECVAAMFIAQYLGVDMSISQQITVVFTALLASIGAAGIPMAGLVMISVILTAVGLPVYYVGLILAVDRPLDMLRTAINVWSDSCGAMIIAKSEGEKLNY